MASRDRKRDREPTETLEQEYATKRMAAYLSTTIVYVNEELHAAAYSEMYGETDHHQCIGR